MTMEYIDVYSMVVGVVNIVEFFILQHSPADTYTCTVQPLLSELLLSEHLDYQNFFCIKIFKILIINLVAMATNDVTKRVAIVTRINKQIRLSEPSVIRTFWVPLCSDNRG